MEQNNNNNSCSPKLNGDVGGGGEEGCITEEGGVRESESPPSTSSMLTLRMVMQGKEAGSIIGKKGDNVKKFREDSGARINISDASCPERIVTVIGTTEQIVSAFTMICRRFEEDLQNSNPSPVATTTKQLITLRLILPASQCGSLIGKGGMKIKEIRDVAGASIQISSDMLPNSTERSVTVAGSVDAVTRGIYHICNVMLECPPKGATIPYRPKMIAAAAAAASMTPVILAGGQAYTVQGHHYVISQPPDPRSSQHHNGAGGMGNPGVQQTTHMVPYQAMHHPQQYAKMAMLPQGIMGGHPMYAAATSQQAYLAAASYHQALSMGGFVRAPPPSICLTHTQEMTIPNEFIGCIIGRGGTKINEIRQLSGANIKISGSEEGLNDRVITVTGLPESISAAVYLINASLEMHKSLALANAIEAPPSSTLTNQSQYGGGTGGSTAALEAAGLQTNALALAPYGSTASFSRSESATPQSMPTFGSSQLNCVALSSYNPVVAAAAGGISYTSQPTSSSSGSVDAKQLRAAAIYGSPSLAFSPINPTALQLPPSMITSTAMGMNFTQVLNSGGYNALGMSPASVVSYSPQSIAIPYAPPPTMMKSVPMLSYGGLTYIDPAHIAKVKGGLTLAAANRYSPY